jgi:hypothetical protein
MSTNDTYVAIVTLGPRPVENFRISNSYQNPTQAQLTWTNPTTTMLGEPIGDYTLIVRRDGQQIAQLPAGTTSYTDQGLNDGQRYFYEIVVRTNDGLESTPVSESVFTGGALEPMPPTELVTKPHDDGILLEWINPSLHVDSSYFHDFDRVVVYSNGQAVDSIRLPLVQAGQRSSHLLRLPTKQFYWISLRAVGKRGQSETYSAQTQQVLAYSGSPLGDLHATFDRDASDTVAFYGYNIRSSDGVIVPTNPQWSRTNIRSLSSPNALTDSPSGNYLPGTINTVVLAPFVVPATKTTFSFAHIALIRAASSHYGSVQYSTDFGRTWKWWATFNRSSVPAWGNNATVQTAPWYWAHFPLSQHVGDTVFVRFVLTAGAIGSDDGWYLDNIGLTDSVASVDEQPISLGPRVDIAPMPAQDEVTIRVTTPRPDLVELTIVDMLGQLVEPPLQVTTSSVVELRYNVSSLPQGVYLVRCASRESVTVEKFTIAR